MAKRKQIVVEKVDPKLEQEWVKAGIGAKIVPYKSTVTELNDEMDREYGWAKGSIPDTLNCILRELVRARLERG